MQRSVLCTHSCFVFAGLLLTVLEKNILCERLPKTVVTPPPVHQSSFSSVCTRRHADAVWHHVLFGAKSPQRYECAVSCSQHSSQEKREWSKEYDNNIATQFYLRSTNLSSCWRNWFVLLLAVTRTHNNLKKFDEQRRHAGLECYNNYDS